MARFLWIKRADLENFLDAHAHACPHCPELEREWVVTVEDIKEFLATLDEQGRG